MKWYAKTENEETIQEHTDALLKNLDILREHLREEENLDDRFWEMLKIVVQYHDIGKFDLRFQNNMHEKLGKEPPFQIEQETFIPHNYISVALMPFEEWNLPTDVKSVVAQAVGYHHEREIAPNPAEIKRLVREELTPYFDEIKSHLKLPLPNKIKAAPVKWIQKRITPSMNESLFYLYVLLKGILHRLDHASSAGVSVEVGISESIGQYTNTFFEEKLQKPKRPLQQFAEKEKDSHVVTVAQTGMGKTEAALLWAGNQKLFFTLPLRVSLNAMYTRMIDENNIGFPEEYTGLLHSTSLEMLEEHFKEKEEKGYSEALYAHSRQHANRLMLTTVDQILKFPFYYLGFEKELSALCGAKVVIDELQAYDPKIAAMLIRALEMIDQVGGSFMIMTATLPTIYKNEILKNKKITNKPIVYEEFYDNTLRHRVQVKEASLLDCTEEILTNKKDKKILIICNTIARAKEVYKKLDNENTNVHLLHAQFKAKDRQTLEKEIQAFAKSEEAGIWVTTQLVEASLDIDFDELHTEISPLDSQFQRYGRCYRKRELFTELPNVFVYTYDVSGIGSVYSTDITNKSIELLQKRKKEELFEKEKMELIEELYSKERLADTDYLKTFNDSLEYFRNIVPYEITKEKAQEYLRNIQNIKVLPEDDLEVQDLIETYKSDKSKRKEIRRELERHVISVNKYRAEKFIHRAGLPASLNDFYMIECRYNYDEESRKGLGLEWAEGVALFSVD